MIAEFSNFFGVAWTETLNAAPVFRMKPMFTNFSGVASVDESEWFENIDSLKLTIIHRSGGNYPPLSLTLR